MPTESGSVPQGSRPGSEAAPLCRPQPHTAASATSTPLGLEEDERVRAAAIAPILEGTPVAPLREGIEAALTGLWSVPVAVLPEAARWPIAAIAPLLAEGDRVWVSPALMARQRHELQALATAGWTLETVSIDAAALADRLEQLDADVERVWLLADALDGRTGQEVSLEALGLLMADEPRLHLLLDDTWHMGWQGAGGRGHVLAESPCPERMLVVANLAPSFGAELAMVASQRSEWVELIRASVPDHGFDPARLGGAIAVASLHTAGELKPLRARLTKRLQICDRVLHVHRLPALGASTLPYRWVAAGSPGAAYAVAGQLMADGHLVSVAMVPGADGPKAALRFSVSLAQPLEELQALVEAIARSLQPALERAGTTFEAFGQAHGMAPTRHHGETIDMATWRSGRQKANR